MTATLMPAPAAMFTPTPAPAQALSDLADWREVRNSACPCGCKVYRADTGTEAVVHLPAYGCGTELRVVPVTRTLGDPRH